MDTTHAILVFLFSSKSSIEIHQKTLVHRTNIIRQEDEQFKQIDTLKHLRLNFIIQLHLALLNFDYFLE